MFSTEVRGKAEGGKLLWVSVSGFLWVSVSGFLWVSGFGQTRIKELFSLSFTPHLRYGRLDFLGLGVLGLGFGFGFQDVSRTSYA